MFATDSPCLADIDRDNSLEIITGAHCFETDGSLKWRNYPLSQHGAQGRPVVIDIDNDSRCEVIYSASDLGVVCIMDNRTIKWTYFDTAYGDSYRDAFCIADLDNDGSFEIVVATQAGYIICLNSTGQLLWSFKDESSSPISELAISDLDGDNVLEIVFCGSFRTVCLSNEGNLKWRYTFPVSSYEHIAIGNLNPNKTTKEILVNSNTRFYCLSNDGNLIRNGEVSFSSTHFTEPLLVDLDNDDIMEIIIGNEKGIFMCLDRYLNLRWSYDTRASIWHPPSVVDINGDGKLEILVVSTDARADTRNGIHCFSSRGKQKWFLSFSFTLSGELALADIDNDNIVEIITYSTARLYCLDIVGVTQSGPQERFSYGEGMLRTRCLDIDGDNLDNNLEKRYNCSPESKDNDSDGLSDGDEVYIYRTDPVTYDTDEDLMPDGWEIKYKLNPVYNDSQEDFDGDGLSNLDEYLYGINPKNIDSDLDGLNDSEEILIYFTNPAKNDTDNDALEDYDELFIYSTNPILNDTEGDGMGDGWEIQYSLNPLFNDSFFDNDSDGLINLIEYEYLINPHSSDSDSDDISDSDEIYIHFTNPGKIDTDDDLLTDWEEIFQYFTLPNNRDTDSDEMIDGWEISNGLNPHIDDSEEDFDGDGLSNLDEFLLGTLPNIDDTDSDGMPDGWEVENELNPLVVDSGSDPDGDGVLSASEYVYGTNPNDRDSDNDLMPDGWEISNGLKPTIFDSIEDADSDLLLNLQEYEYHTNPNDADTDTDGVTDWFEIFIHYTSPTDIDTDDDSMPDGWEIEFELNPLVNDAFEDYDNDGITNYEEYLQGKNPQILDNFTLLFGKYFAAIWVGITLAAILIPRKSRRIIFQSFTFIYQKIRLIPSIISRQVGKLMTSIRTMRKQFRFKLSELSNTVRRKQLHQNFWFCDFCGHRNIQKVQFAEGKRVEQQICSKCYRLKKTKTEEIE
jgi:hypothetical protein